AGVILEEREAVPDGGRKQRQRGGERRNGANGNSHDVQTTIGRNPRCPSRILVGDRGVSCGRGVAGGRPIALFVGGMGGGRGVPPRSGRQHVLPVRSGRATVVTGGRFRCD